MIRIERPDGPTVLTDAAGKGRAERQEAVKSLQAHKDAGKPPEKWSFKFKAYKLKDVNAAINGLFHGKCAYCESSYRATQPVDVEHWRPKGQAIVEEDRRTTKTKDERTVHKPGYYWLAADWNNLLPSCIDCNRKRNQHDVIEDRTVSVGKKDEFPLRDPNAVARKPGQEANEEPLLLNPCEDHPEEVLTFDEENEGVMQPARPDGPDHERAKASMRVYGLNRVGLVLNRKLLATQTALRIATIKGLLRLKRELSEDSETLLIIDELLMGELRELARARRPERPYSLLTRQMIDRQFDEFEALAGLAEEDPQ